MCGFAALVEPERIFEPVLLDAMDRDLYHRGPDSAGRLSQRGAALVFRRLAILDPRAEADQPMTDASGRYTIVFNGEIYNYRDLREALIGDGARLRTRGDTEVLLEGYARWGEAVLDRLEGMYAFAILDRERGVMAAARDPFGIKPLYLLRRGRLAALASEMRPFWRLVPARPDADALAELLTHGWAAGTLSNYEGVERVPGGTVLTISLADGSVQRRRFADPLETLRPNGEIDGEEAERRAEDALRASVKAHLMSDVGYTVQLSGGVDSSLVTALAGLETPRKLVTFGINLGNFVHDESRYRRPVVERYGLDHREIPVSGGEFADAFPRAVHHMEGPSPHLGCVLLMRLCDRISETSKVVLTGEGGDEMFGGYERYGLWRKMALQERIGRLLPYRLWPPVWPFAGVRRLAGLDAAAYSGTTIDIRALHALFPALVPKPGAREAASRRFRDFRERMFAVDQIAYLESLLVRQDKMAMAASVEARVPLVHLPLARLLNQLPHDVRAPGAITKPLLKRIAERYLPRELVYRRKVGLLLPYQQWLADADGLGRYLEHLTAPDCRLAAYAAPGVLAALVDRYRAGARSVMPVLMRLINVETWLRDFPAAPV